MRNLYFRADGSATIGLGHLTRCLAVAEMAIDHFKITFLLDKAPTHFIAQLAGRGISYRLVNGLDWIELLQSNDVVVVDDYLFNVEQQSAVRRRCALVCIDDLADREFDADLVINHCPGINVDEYQSKTALTHYALGPDYCLLRSEFLKIAREKVQRPSGSRLMICFGGADPLNLTARSVSLLADAKEIESIDVIVGSSYQFQTSLAKCASSKVSVYSSLSSFEMLQRMKANTFALVSASTILFECIAAGLRCMAVAYVQNQRRIYDGFCKNNTVIGLEDLNDLVPKLPLLLTIDDQQLSSMIDGYSGRRICKLLTSLRS